MQQKSGDHRGLCVPSCSSRYVHWFRVGSDLSSKFGQDERPKEMESKKFCFKVDDRRARF